MSLLLLLPCSKSWHQALLREYCDVSGYLCTHAEGSADQQEAARGVHRIDPGRSPGAPGGGLVAQRPDQIQKRTGMAAVTAMQQALR